MAYRLLRHRLIVNAETLVAVTGGLDTRLDTRKDGAMTMTMTKRMGWRALVVATDPVDRLATTRALDEGGYDVTAVDSFERARVQLVTIAPDVLVTDVRLESFNGLHLVWEQSFRRVTVPAIVMHDFGDAALESDARELGCLFLVKPVQRDVLLHAVGTLVGAQEVVSAYDLWHRPTGLEIHSR